MTLSLAGFELDDERLEIRFGGERISARQQVIRFLILLAHDRHRVVSREEVEHTIWPGTRVSDGSLTNLVFEARALVGDDGRRQDVIRTVRGEGYRLVAPVGEQPPAEPQESSASSPFVGRERAMGQLDACLKDCEKGGTRIVLLAGEPGIGKSCTAEEFVSRLDGSTHRHVIARCIESEAAPPFWPWIQVLRAWSGSPTRPPLEYRDAVELEEMMSEVSDEPADARVGEAALARFRRFEAVARVLAAHGSAKPIVIVLEDLHRADTASLQLLEFVAAARPNVPMLILATHRDTEAGRSSEFSRILARLARMEATDLVALHGLGLEDVSNLVEAILGRTPRSLPVERLHRHTGGNPFFLHQLIRLVEARGLLDSNQSELDFSPFLDPGMREATLEHLAGLTINCRAMLERASVVGRECSVAVLEALSASGEPEVAGLIREALYARVIFLRDDEICFSHVLIRDALYESLDVTTRMALHGLVGRILDRMHGASSPRHTPEIAHHYLAGDPADFAEDAIRFQGEAARVATNRLAYEDAVQHRENALRALEQHDPKDDARRCDLLIELGDARMRSDDRPGGSEAFRHAVDLARSCRDGERLARAALGYSPGLLALEVDVVDDYHLETLELAVEWTTNLDTPLRARLLGRLAMALAWTDQAERRRELAEEAIGIAERLGDPGTRAFALSARVAAFWGPGDAEIRVDLSVRALDLASEAGDREQELVAILHRATSQLQLGRFAAARGSMELFAARALALRQPHATWWISLFLAHQSLMRGDFEATLAWTRAFAEEGGKAQDHNAALCGPTVTAFCCGERGDAEGGFDGMSRKVVFAQANPNAARRATFAAFGAWAGDVDTAREELAAFASQGFDRVPRDMMWVHTMGFLAETAACLEDEESARVIYALLRPLEGQFVVSGLAVMVWRPFSYLLGRLATTLGDYDGACAHFGRAMADCEAAEMQVALAFIHRGHAVALERRGGEGDLDLAREARATANALVDRLGIRRHLGLG